ncbi:ABC transporter permease [Fodinisporobacter ferrooxydans]|uniref:ABC transporter permease n=1 Tax=Fodinisporobacter ferrooxydans TaxID=2901836 RepID=A0ABY4CXC2_9BACL|nr:ABC transporter permease [Alicyclobacillaceae bacterium MYW30-H2]
MEKQLVTSIPGDSTPTHTLRRFFEKLAPFLFLIFIMIILSVISPNFLTIRNLLTILLQISIVGIITVGETMVLITAGVDLSVGSIVGLSGVLSTLLMADVHFPIWLAVIGGIIVGGLVGMVNGVLVTKVKLPSFISTLGMMGVARGFALILTGGVTVFNLPDQFGWIGGGRFAGIPVPVYFLVAVGIIGTFVLNRTRLGRYTYAIGSNSETARLSGINISKYLVIIYAIAGTLSGLAGVILASRIITGEPTAGLGYELDVIAACVIGGTSLFGGEGTVLGSMIGAALMGVIRNGSDLLNISAFWQQVIIGIIIWGAVAWDSYRRRKVG